MPPKMGKMTRKETIAIVQRGQKKERKTPKRKLK
jgi:hypothetical protein